ncbi:MAG: hypothetical protein HY315_04685 [Acidobacteria bacterium]|nr:hypothetical protein [Acidobacteriota bacterium]
MNQLRLSSVAIALLLFLAPGCGRTSSPPQQRADAFPLPPDAQRVEVRGKFGGRIIHPLLRPPRSYNPLAASDEDTLLVTSLTHATLLEMDRISMQIVPGLAKSWRLENSGRSVRLQLRRGVRFSDGEPFTADDVIFTFDAIYAENSHNTRKDDLTLRDRKITYTRVSDQEVLLDFPFVYAPALYLLSTVPILPRHLLQSTSPQKPVETFMDPESNPAQCAGLGPFRLRTADAGENIVLEANPHYWRVDSSGKRLPYLNEVVLPVVSNRDSAFLQFRSGMLDLVDRLRIEDYVALAEKQSESVQVLNVGASTRLDLLWVNQNESFRSPKRAYFNNPLFRQGLARAIDRKALVEHVYHGQAQILSEFWPPSIPRWLSSLPPYPYDPEGAIALFQRAGLRVREHDRQRQLVDGAGRPLTLTLLTNTNPVKEAIATMLQQDFLRVGIQAQISQNDARAVIDRFLNKRDYEAVLFTLALPPEPTDLQSVLKSSGEQHMWHPAQKTPATRWEEEIDRLVDAMAAIPEPEKRRESFTRIQQILMEQLPVIPLTSEHILVGLRRSVKNVRPSVLPPYLLWNAWELYRD